SAGVQELLADLLQEVARALAELHLDFVPSRRSYPTAPVDSADVVCRDLGEHAAILGDETVPGTSGIHRDCGVERVAAQERAEQVEHFDWGFVTFWRPAQLGPAFGRRHLELPARVSVAESTTQRQSLP